jgi:hypothetical protein
MNYLETHRLVHRDLAARYIFFIDFSNLEVNLDIYAYYQLKTSEISEPLRLSS